jgi:hypothetical protein
MIGKGSRRRYRFIRFYVMDEGLEHGEFVEQGEFVLKRVNCIIENTLDIKITGFAPFALCSSELAVDHTPQ